MRGFFVGHQHYKKKKRMREVSFDKIEVIKKTFKFTYKDIADLLCVSLGQVNHYKQSCSLPLSRYIAARDALLVSADEEAAAKRKQIMELFNTD